MSQDIKPLCVVRAPCTTRSGYGDMSRDIIRHLIEWDKFDVKVHSVNWGDTPMNALNANNPKDKMILDRILREPLNRQPDLFVTITIPSEFQPLGKYNIGITAGIETNAVSAEWLQACNAMDAVFTISEHSKGAFTQSKYGYQTPQGTKGVLELSKPIEVLHNCIDTNVIGKNAPIDNTFSKYLDEMISEDFNYLFVGHWLRGDFGEDRKNVGVLIKVFLETFKRVADKSQPALILKTSSAGFSILDREEIISKINSIKASVVVEPGQKLPNVYLLHGELTDQEMNTLYNHSKVKVHISLTKGEGFGRPLLEASVSGKPVIASGWSGHLDFLNKENAILIGGELKQIHESSVWDNILIKESAWFTADPNNAANAMWTVFNNYSDFKKKSYDLALKNRKDFSYENIRQKTFDLLNKYVPEFPKQMSLTLPNLKKITLPKLKKVEPFKPDNAE